VTERTIEPQLSKEGSIDNDLGWKLFACDQDTDSDREIERRTNFAK
jgi:hypothetical protein